MFTYINKHLLSFSLDSSKDVGNPCSNVVLISALLVHRQGQFMQSHICTDSLAVSMHLRSNIFDVYFKWLYIFNEILHFSLYIEIDNIIKIATSLAFGKYILR